MSNVKTRESRHFDVIRHTFQNFICNSKNKPNKQFLKTNNNIWVKNTSIRVLPSLFQQTIDSIAKISIQF